MMQKVTLNSYFPFTRFNLGYEAVVELVIPLLSMAGFDRSKEKPNKGHRPHIIKRLSLFG